MENKATVAMEAQPQVVMKKSESKQFAYKRNMIKGFLLVAAVSAVTVASVGIVRRYNPGMGIDGESTQSHQVLRRGSAGGHTEQCISYSPFHNDKYHSNIQAALHEDLSKVARHFSCVKSYYSSFYGTNFGKIAADHGLNVVLGVHTDDMRLRNQEVTNAIEACQALGSRLKGIIIGSENIAPYGSLSPKEIKAIAYVIRMTGCKAPIGTSQRINEYLHGADWSELADNLDFLGVTIYPFFSHLRSQWEPMEMLQAQLREVKNKFPVQAHKFIVTETGWPTAGSPMFGNLPSVDLAQNHFSQFSRLACRGQLGPWASHYTFFDEQSRQYPDVNQHFGLTGVYGNPKFHLSNEVC